MNTRLRELNVLVMYILAFAGMLILALGNIEAIWINLFIALCWLFSFTIRNLYIYKTDVNRKYAFITYITEIMLMFYISLGGTRSSVELLLCVTAADCFIACEIKYGVICSLSALLSYIIIFLIKQPFTTKGLLLILGKEAPIFMLAGLISCLMGMVLKSNAFAEKSMNETKLREVELKAAYEELNKAYNKLEEMSSIKERNRIAREIHDTVGHTLTTVIVEMEAGRMLAAKDTSLANEKFLMAHKQAVKALEELRKSVRILEKGNILVNLKEMVLEAIEETEVHTGVAVRSIIEIPESVESKLANLIIRLLKEGLSNGIRHGKGTAFFLKLTKENNKILFVLQDNGKGCETITPGFGLNNMEKGVLEAGGKVKWSSELEEGFEIEIELPLGGEELDGNNKGLVS